ncbi:MAG TPA: hypothetical protein VFL27_07535 [Candidatus Dormibacteraeota bacterium]|nr:hypothetical protein [Candidatus Dormibacteraeota bacterium]
MARWLGAVALLIGVLISGSTAALAATDLQSLLASPPSSDWVMSSAGSDILAGPFTAQSYGAYVDQSTGTPGRTASGLEADGFIAGYADAWIQTTTRDALAERVFEFRSSLGADDWFSGVRVDSERLQSRTGDIPGAAQIPDSMGVVLTYSTGVQWRLDFRKGNLVFVVHADSFTAGEDLSNLAVRQARTEYDAAPAGAVTGLSGGSVFPGWILPVGGGIIATIFVATAGAILLIWSLGRRRGGAPHGVHVSPDGRYWWDGTAWQPTRPGSAGPV